jgi:aspartyl-tRNA(Asn)/glutamyl-tRNA(Gln) amidotransferase subunit C
MRIEVDQVRHIARLAELAVGAADATRLAGELEEIVAMVERLTELDDGSPVEPLVVGPASVGLRPDIVAPIPLTRRPRELAPDMREGFFVVPRLEGMADE